MKVNIEKGRAAGSIYAPTSKSDAHRLLICAALAEGESVISGVSSCDDVDATVRCLTALGASIEIDKDTYTVRGFDPKSADIRTPLDCAESGSTIRFLIPLCSLSGKEVKLIGKGRLMDRPFDVYEGIFNEKGARFKKSDDITLRGALTPGEYALKGNVSSQFISGLLFALPLLEGDSVIRITPPYESRSYVEMTLATLNKFGIRTICDGEFSIRIPGNQKYSAIRTRAEGDFSGAAFPAALNLFGSDVKILGLKDDSLQSDKAYERFYPMLASGYADIDISDCPDLGPVLFAVAAGKHGAKIRGTARLRIKESDRVMAMTEELRKMGAVISVYENEVLIAKTDLHAPNSPLNAHGDHRIVMALAILLCSYGGEIEGAEVIAKSYPAFFEDLIKLGLGITFYD